MGALRSYLPSIGGFLAFAGLLSIVLHFIGYNLRLLLWIDLWGPGVGWVIRIGLILGGAALLLVGRAPAAKEDKKAEEKKDEEDDDE